MPRVGGTPLCICWWGLLCQCVGGYAVGVATCGWRGSEGVSAGRVSRLVERLGEPEVRSGDWWEGEGWFRLEQGVGGLRSERSRVVAAQAELLGESGEYWRWRRGVVTEGSGPVMGASGREGGGRVRVSQDELDRRAVEQQGREYRRNVLGRRKRLLGEQIAAAERRFGEPLSKTELAYIDEEWRRRLRANVERYYVQTQGAPKGAADSRWLAGQAHDLNPSRLRDEVELDVRWQRVERMNSDDPREVRSRFADPEVLKERAKQRRQALYDDGLDLYIDPDDPYAAGLRSIRDEVMGRREKYYGVGPDRIVTQEAITPRRFDETGYDRRPPKKRRIDKKTKKEIDDSSGFELSLEERRAERQAQADAESVAQQDMAPATARQLDELTDREFEATMGRPPRRVQEREKSAAGDVIEGGELTTRIAPEDREMWQSIRKDLAASETTRLEQARMSRSDFAAPAGRDVPFTDGPTIAEEVALQGVSAEGVRRRGAPETQRAPKGLSQDAIALLHDAVAKVEADRGITLPRHRSLDAYSLEEQVLIRDAISDVADLKVRGKAPTSKSTRNAPNDFEEAFNYLKMQGEIPPQMRVPSDPSVLPTALRKQVAVVMQRIARERG